MKDEALRLADELSKSHLNHHINHAAAAELRRLVAQRDALLAIVRRVADQGCVTDDGCGYCLPCEAEAAIKKAEGENT